MHFAKLNVCSFKDSVIKDFSAVFVAKRGKIDREKNKTKKK